MTANSANQYPVNHQTPLTEAFLDKTVTIAEMFRHGELIRYGAPDGSGAGLTSKFSQPGDGFSVGLASPNHWAQVVDGDGAAIIETERATYLTDGSVYVRHEPGQNGGRARIRISEAEKFGMGISGRIGGTIQLPGSEGPEKVLSVELEREVGESSRSLSVRHVPKRSPFYGGRILMEISREKLDGQKLAKETGRYLAQVATQSNKPE